MKEVRLKAVEVDGAYMYFVFPSQLAVNKFLDIMEQCELCDINWLGSERLAVKRPNATQKFTIQTIPVLTRPEFDAAVKELERIKELEESETASEEVVEAVQAEAGIPDEAQDMAEIFEEEEAKAEDEIVHVSPHQKLAPGEPDPRD